MRLACSQPHTKPLPWWQLLGRLGGGKAAATETILYLNNNTPLMWTDGEVGWAAGSNVALESAGVAQEGMLCGARREGRHAGTCQLGGKPLGVCGPHASTPLPTSFLQEFVCVCPIKPEELVVTKKLPEVKVKG